MLAETQIQKSPDFPLTGDGFHAHWQATDWLTMPVLQKENQYQTRAKILYSDTGLYFLFDCDDAKLTCTKIRDFDDLFNEDVVEIFLQPNAADAHYFEYEISPLGFELPILVANSEGHFHGWLPWHYEGARQTRRATSIRGGNKEPGASCTGWSAEFFIPFALLTGLIHRPPRAGDCWRGNLYRLDFDTGAPNHWTWSQSTGSTFHDFKKFGTFRFL